ncbi:putative ORFan [Cotonvirus japonicus]|uniref:ORFan n=1 Tax=Cotonvirus japonicus TaxID=2811091 RepID=A0ABM7NTR2_9VIRU|nr:putative ORFan [Cotonvirus japonicus]BCS83506.1 putative ORFan [Cotonvirus japonicus]
MNQFNSSHENYLKQQCLVNSEIIGQEITDHRSNFNLVLPKKSIGLSKPYKLSISSNDIPDFEHRLNYLADCYQNYYTDSDFVHQMHKNLNQHNSELKIKTEIDFDIVDFDIEPIFKPVLNVEYDLK